MFLARCEELKLAGFNPGFEPGRCVARGFSDLGFEVFQLVRGDKLVSLFTGKLSEKPHDFEKHFFAVLSCDDMAGWLDRYGYDIGGLRYVEQRRWELSLRCSEDQVEVKIEGGTLDEVFLEALHYAFQSPRQARCTQ